MNGPTHTPDVVAKILGVSEAEVHRLIEDGELRSLRTKRGEHVVTDTMIRDYLGEARPIKRGTEEE